MFSKLMENDMFMAKTKKAKPNFKLTDGQDGNIGDVTLQITATALCTISFIDQPF